MDKIGTLYIHKTLEKEHPLYLPIFLLFPLLFLLDIHDGFIHHFLYV